jgi:hypothetical protein
VGNGGIGPQAYLHTATKAGKSDKAAVTDCAHHVTLEAGGNHLYDAMRCDRANW